MNGRRIVSDDANLAGSAGSAGSAGGALEGAAGEGGALDHYYASRVGESDRDYLKPERRSDLHRIEQLVPTLFIDQSIIELACGTGYWTRLLATAARHVLATDIGEETLAIAARRGFDPEKVSLLQADAYDLPADCGPFEGAFAAFWWSLVPIERRNAFLAALSRRLAPGSKVVFVDDRYVEGSSTPIAGRDAQGNTWGRYRPEGGNELRVLRNYPSAAEVRLDMQRHGQVLGLLETQYYWVVAWVTPKP